MRWFFPFEFMHEGLRRHRSHEFTAIFKTARFINHKSRFTIMWMLNACRESSIIVKTQMTLYELIQYDQWRHLDRSMWIHPKRDKLHYANGYYYVGNKMSCFIFDVLRISHEVAARTRVILEKIKMTPTLSMIYNLFIISTSEGSTKYRDIMYREKKHIYIRMYKDYFD